jgi:vancomycin permeability regulator SanA
MVAVSQSFHLPRIIYICSDFGVRTVGVPAFKQENYLNNREVLARAKAVWQTEITQPQPDNMWEVKFGF